ncbi:hypothetical protein BZA77DRAFT_390249 [Pyronema omphalodes]|nr:hypothetical protein BZA77DRAFT_390249 [Pyronema omphalodes]
MPRTLPWLQTTTSAPNATSKPTKPEKPANSSKTTDEITSASKPPKKRRSTLKPTPDEDFSAIGLMLPSDSHWIMVEDEFLSTAQLFTRSLHRLEYQRLQLEATSRNASKISHIQRPVVSKGPSQDALKLRSLAAKVQAQEAAISRKRRLRDMDRTENGEENGEEDEEEDLDTGLGLMMSQRLPEHRGLGELMQRGKVKTRAAQGFKDSVPTASPVKNGHWREGSEVPVSPILRRQGNVAGPIRSVMGKEMLRDEDETEEAEDTEYDSDDIDAGYKRRMKLQKKAALRAAKEAAAKEAWEAEAEAARAAKISKAEHTSQARKSAETKSATDSDFDSDDLDAPIHLRYKAAKKAEAAKLQTFDPLRSIPQLTTNTSLRRTSSTSSTSLSSVSVQRSGSSGTPGISGMPGLSGTSGTSIPPSKPDRTATDPSLSSLPQQRSVPHHTLTTTASSTSTLAPQRTETAPTVMTTKTTKYVSDEDDDWIINPLQVRARVRGRSAVVREREREREMRERGVRELEVAGGLGRNDGGG